MPLRQMNQHQSDKLKKWCHLHSRGPQNLPACPWTENTAICPSLIQCSQEPMKFWTIDNGHSVQTFSLHTAMCKCIKWVDMQVAIYINFWSEVQVTPRLYQDKLHYFFPLVWMSKSVFFLQIFIYRACGTNEIKSAALSSTFWMESS
jgi:hypothetical protein